MFSQVHRAVLAFERKRQQKVASSTQTNHQLHSRAPEALLVTEQAGGRRIEDVDDVGHEERGVLVVCGDADGDGPIRRPQGDARETKPDEDRERKPGSRRLNGDFRQFPL